LLGPDISSMLNFFHAPVVSAVHSIVQSPPSLNLSPGAGPVGVSWPATKGSVRRAARKKRDIIKEESTSFCWCLMIYLIVIPKGKTKSWQGVKRRGIGG